MASVGERVEVRVLGPLRVYDVDGRDRTPTGALQRRLLALLVLRRGQVVSSDLAADVLWPDGPPRDPIAAVHNHVSRLRQALPEGSLEWTGDGYCLSPERVDVDAERLARALAADPGDDAGAVVDELLARWQGAAYPELADTDDGIVEAARLDEIRRRAIEHRAARRLANGDTDGLVAELTALADEVPTRERPRELLIEALAAAGRTADALRAYDDFRRLLGDELGIEPSAALTGRHSELLVGTRADTWHPAPRLPSPPTQLLGRDALVDVTLSATAEHRLVTLVGPGGVGKTRLVTEVGHRIRSARAQRPVVFCELSSATGESVVDVVVSALGISPRAGVPGLERVVEALATVEMTLILDNCEHVLEAAAVLAERILADCPQLRLIATSRERIRIAGEHLITVPPLDHASDAAPAVELFVERARAVVPGFQPEAGTIGSIHEIVTRLDGLPLAIELAASRLQTHEVDEVAAGLDRRFQLLSAGARTSARHGSLSAAVAWSFELLGPELQRVFSALSVFVTSFTVDAAAAVAGLPREGARAALDDLVERSLVVRRADRRYALLETLRAFGAEQLADAEAAAVRDRHAAHQITWIEDTVRRLDEPGSQVLVAIEEALPELRAALTFLVEGGDVPRAARLVTELFDYGFLRQRPDVLAWADRVIDLRPDDRYPRAAVVRAVAGYAAWMAGDVARLGAEARRALAAAETDGQMVPEAAGAWASHELFEGHLDDAREWYERGAEVAADKEGRRPLYRSSALLARAYGGDPATAAAAADLLDDVGDLETPYVAYAWYCAGESDLGVDHARAHERYSRALELAERTGASFVEGLARASRASIEARAGDPAVAVREYRVLLDEWRRAGVWSTQWTMLRSVAGLLSRLGRHHDAALLVGAVSNTAAGHRIFGADEEALRELTQRLREALGDAALDAALAAGSMLDGDAAVDHARRAL